MKNKIYKTLTNDNGVLNLDGKELSDGDYNLDNIFKFSYKRNLDTNQIELTNVETDYVTQNEIILKNGATLRVEVKDEVE